MKTEKKENMTKKLKESAFLYIIDCYVNNNQELFEKNINSLYDNDIKEFIKFVKSKTITISKNYKNTIIKVVTNIYLKNKINDIK